MLLVICWHSDTLWALIGYWIGHAAVSDELWHSVIFCQKVVPFSNLTRTCSDFHQIKIRTCVLCSLDTAPISVIYFSSAAMHTFDSENFHFDMSICMNALIAHNPMYSAALKASQYVSMFWKHISPTAHTIFRLRALQFYRVLHTDLLVILETSTGETKLLLMYMLVVLAVKKYPSRTAMVWFHLVLSSFCPIFLKVQMQPSFTNCFPEPQPWPLQQLQEVSWCWGEQCGRLVNSECIGFVQASLSGVKVFVVFFQGGTWIFQLTWEGCWQSCPPRMMNWKLNDMWISVVEVWVSQVLLLDLWMLNWMLFHVQPYVAHRTCPKN